MDTKLTYKRREIDLPRIEPQSKDQKLSELKGTVSDSSTSEGGDEHLSYERVDFKAVSYIKYTPKLLPLGSGVDMSELSYELT